MAEVLTIGMKVRVKSTGGGWFDGYVTGFSAMGNIALITPVEQALRDYHPTGYDLGKAHWRPVEVLEQDHPVKPDGERCEVCTAKIRKRPGRVDYEHVADRIGI